MARQRFRGGKLARRLFFLLVFLPMLVVFPYQRSINNPNEFSRVFTSMAIVENGKITIDEQVTTFGWTNDLAKVPSKEDGQLHYVMVKAPGAVYLGTPGYFLFSKVAAPILGRHYPKATATQEEKLWWLKGSTWALRLFGAQIPCFLFLLWLERYLRAFTQDPALRYTAVAACGLGTNYLAYTHMFASHAQYAAIAFLAFALIETESRRSRGDPTLMKRSRAFLAGLLTATCVMFEYHALFLCLLFCLYAWIVFYNPVRALRALFGKGPKKKGEANPLLLALFGLGGLLVVPTVMLFHWKAYNNPFTPGHQMLEVANFSATHQTGLWGVVWPTWDHVVALSVDPGFGFFAMSPFMWLGVVGFPLLMLTPYGRGPERRALRSAVLVCGLAGATLFAVNAGIIVWRAGWTVGPRYLAAAPPFFAFLSVCALERFSGASRLRRGLARGFGGGLALASVLSIGTVGLMHDTLPESIARPFTQFTIPMAYARIVPHHVGEWFGIESPWVWFVATGAALLAAVFAGVFVLARETRLAFAGRVLAFVVTTAAGVLPAFWPPDDGSKILVLHPSVASFPAGWEPQGRDRVSLLRIEADRHGSRGHGPCLWHELAAYERILGNEGAALRDEAKAHGIPKSRCPNAKKLF